MNQKLSVLFYLNKSKINKKDNCPIYCRITYQKKENIIIIIAMNLPADRQECRSRTCKRYIKRQILSRPDL